MSASLDSPEATVSESRRPADGTVEWPRWATFAALVAGLALRLRALTAGTLSLDESYTTILAERTLLDALRLAPTEANPPLLTAFYRFWTPMVGPSELALELPSVLFGVLAILLVGRLATRLRGEPWAGVVAAWLLALSPLHLAISQLVRVYSLAIVLSIVAFGGLVEILRRQGGACRYLLGSLGLLYAHYYGALVLASWFVVAAVTVHRTSSARALWRISLAIGIGGLPVLYWVTQQYLRYYSFDWIEPPSAALLLEPAVRLSGGWLALLLFGALIGGVLVAGKGRSYDKQLLLAWLLGPWVLAVVASLVGRPFFDPRYAALWLVPWILLAADGALGWGRRLGTLLVVTVGTLGLVVYLPDYYQSRYDAGREKELLVDVASRRQQDDLLLHLSKETWGPARFYLGPESRLLAGGSTSNVLRYWLEVPAELETASLAQWPRVWVLVPTDGYERLRSLRSDPEFLRLGPRLLERHRSGRAFLYEFTAGSPP